MSGLESAGPGDLELLRLQAVDLIGRGGGDGDGVVGLRGFLIARTRAEEALWVGDGVPADLTRALRAAHVERPSAALAEPADPPAALAACEGLLVAQGWRVERGSGPSYLIEPGSRFLSSAPIERSDTSTTYGLRGGNPGNWHPVEWDELLDGRLGPWAMATVGDRVVSICHTPIAMTATAAECGVWTDPAFRGWGYAAAVTSAWADILRSSGRHLFYSTRTDNLSSRRVADRLKLRLLGWVWRVTEESTTPSSSLHPLSAALPPQPDPAAAAHPRRVVVAFPRIEDPVPWNAILATRDRLDPLAGQVAPHLTLLSPFEDAISDRDLEAHLRAVASALPPFPITLRDVTAHEEEYLFLNVKRGNDALVQLHDTLYTGPLAAHRPRSHTFVPHLTVGRVLPADLPGALEETAPHTTPIQAQVDTLSVYRIDPDGSRPILFEVPLRK